MIILCRVNGFSLYSKSHHQLIHCTHTQEINTSIKAMYQQFIINNRTLQELVSRGGQDCPIPHHKLAWCNHRLFSKAHNTVRQVNIHTRHLYCQLKSLLGTFHVKCNNVKMSILWIWIKPCLSVHNMIRSFVKFWQFLGKRFPSYDCLNFWPPLTMQIGLNSITVSTFTPWTCSWCHWKVMSCKIHLKWKSVLYPFILNDRKSICFLVIQ